MKYEDFEDNVVQWATARKIYEHSTVQAQYIKAVSEMGELGDSIIKGENALDDLGDTIVCLLNVAHMLGLDMQDAFDTAWDDIKDRKGHMVPGGAFVKDRTDG